MKKIESIYSNLKKYWDVPQNATHRGEKTFFKLVCTFNEDKKVSLKIDSSIIPEDLLDFWQISFGAELFVDIDYGEWGLEIFNSDEALKKLKKTN